MNFEIPDDVVEEALYQWGNRRPERLPRPLCGNPDRRAAMTTQDVLVHPAVEDAPAAPGNCWVLVDEQGQHPDDDFAVHYNNEAEASAAAANRAKSGDQHDPRPRQLDKPCQTITCVCCEITYDEDGEGYTVHFDDPQEIPLTGWKPEGDGWRCDVCIEGPCDVEAGNHG